MEAQKTDVNFSNFDLSHVHKTSMDMGKLVPIACIPTLPGDKFNIDVSAFIRGMPTIAPIMDKVDIKINHFYVPYRILWDYFPEFISKSEKYHLRDGNAPTLPVMETSSITKRFKKSFESYKKVQREAFKNFKDTYYKKYPLGKLSDYLGINPIENTDDSKASTYKDLISLMPHLAYNRIFLDYYVPQRWVNHLIGSNLPHWLMNLSKLMEEIKTSPNYTFDSTKMRGTQVANVVNESDLLKIYGYDHLQGFADAGACLLSLKNVFWNHDYFSSALPEPTIFGDVKIPKTGQVDTRNNQGQLDAENQNPTIRDLRKAISLQHYLETLSQGGGRYLETMELMFNKRLPDDMLQYSEYLGGSTIPLFVNEVEQTAPYESPGGKKSYLGDLSGKPVGAGDMENIFFEADEYGVYMCMAHIVPKRSYFNLTHRSWRELDVMEFPNPHFEGIGDQAVYAYELGKVKDSEAYKIWGYVPRYAHYKTALDRFSAEMQDTLSHWHLGDLIDRGVNVTPESIECTPRNDIFQVPSEPDKMICTFNLGIKAVRPLSYNPPVGVNRI